MSASTRSNASFTSRYIWSPSAPYFSRSVRGPAFSSGMTIPPLRACAPQPSRSFSSTVTFRPAAASTRAAASPA